MAVVLAVLFPAVVSFSCVFLWKKSEDDGARRFINENYGLELDGFEYAEEGKEQIFSSGRDGFAYIYVFKMGSDTSDATKRFIAENFRNADGEKIEPVCAADDFLNAVDYLWINYYGNSDFVTRREYVGRGIINDRFCVYDFGETERWSKRIAVTYYVDLEGGRMLFLAEERYIKGSVTTGGSLTSPALSCEGGGTACGGRVANSAGATSWALARAQSLRSQNFLGTYVVTQLPYKSDMKGYPSGTSCHLPLQGEAR